MTIKILPIMEQSDEIQHPEHSITHIWQRFHGRWIMAGGVSGILAGLMIVIVSGIITQSLTGDLWQPLKLIGAAIYGNSATAYGPLGVAGIAGLLIHLFLSLLYGVTFAQLVCEKSRPLSLVIMGIVTSLIIWVFACMLFLPSFDLPLAFSLGRWIGLLLHVLFGLSFALILVFFRSRMAPSDR